MLIYPDECAKCGRKWGDHLRPSARKGNPKACEFVAKPGDLTEPYETGPCPTCPHGKGLHCPICWPKKK